MWFAFGFITLISSCVLSFWMRAAARWTGEPGSADGVRYLSHIQRNKARKPSRLRIGLSAADSLEFTLKRETWLDRLFKSVGLAGEFQVGREAFDKAIYIVSDDEGLCRRLALSRGLQSDVLALFATGMPGVRARKLRCLFGRIWMEFDVDGSFKEESAHLVARDTVPALSRLSDLTAKVAADRSVAEDENRDPFVLRAILILSVSTALAVNGLIQFMRVLLAPLPFIVDDARLAGLTLFAGLILLALLVSAAVNFLGRSARAHMVLIEVLLVGGFGCFASAGTALRDFNVEWDAAVPAHHEVRVLGMHVTRGKGASHYLRVQDWKRPPATLDIKVGAAFYGSVKPGELISVFESPGALGMAWVPRLVNARGLVQD